MTDRYGQLPSRNWTLIQSALNKSIDPTPSCREDNEIEERSSAVHLYWLRRNQPNRKTSRWDSFLANFLPSCTNTCCQKKAKIKKAEIDGGSNQSDKLQKPSKARHTPSCSNASSAVTEKANREYNNELALATRAPTEPEKTAFGAELSSPVIGVETDDEVEPS